MAANMTGHSGKQALAAGERHSRDERAWKECGWCVAGAKSTAEAWPCLTAPSVPALPGGPYLQAGAAGVAVRVVPPQCTRKLF